MSPKSSKSSIDPDRRAEIEREWANGDISSEIMHLRGQQPSSEEAVSKSQPSLGNQPSPDDQVSWCAG